MFRVGFYEFLFLIFLHSQLLRSFFALSVDKVAFVRGPPANTITGGKGGGREYGIRLVSKKECQETVIKWHKTLCVASTGKDMESLEMLLDIENLSQLMPGTRPKRREIIAFGDFVDGSIEVLGIILWKKVLFPDEMEVLAIMNAPRSTESDKHFDMLQYICDMCKDNAIIPHFSRLEKYELFRLPKYRKFLDYSALGKDGSHCPPESDANQDCIIEYINCNRASTVFLDDPYLDVDLGPYWYTTTILSANIKSDLNSPNEHSSQLPINFYFRKKIGKRDNYEIEMSFSKPLTGVQSGSGTVGGALIIPVNAYIASGDGSRPKDFHLMSKSASELESLLRMIEAIKSKIKHPVNVKSTLSESSCK